MAITRAQQARQMLQDGNQVIGPLGEDDLQSGFVSGAKRLLTPGNIGRAAAFLLSGGATSAAEVAKEIAKQKALNEIMDKTGDVVGPKIETKLMKMENEARGTGGFQSDFAQDRDFMGGKGTAAEMGSFAEGGRIGLFQGALADTQGPAGGKAMSPGTGTRGGRRDTPSRSRDIQRGGKQFDTPSKPMRTRIQDEKQQELVNKRIKELVEKQQEEKAFEPFESLIVKPSGVPGFGGKILDIFRGPRQKLLDSNIDFYRNDPRTAKARAKYGLTAQGYKNYMSARLAGEIDAAGNEFIGGREEDDDENQLLLAQAVNPNQATTPTVETPAIDPIFYRLLADGGMPEDAPVGGIMDLETSRQMYGLGKLVKKATRAVKKIVKSPIGKAAMLYFGGQALTGGGLGTFLKKKAMPFLFEGGKFSGGLTGGGKLALGGALTLAPLLFQEEEEDKPIDEASLGERIDILGLLANPYQATLGRGYRRTAADGGRIGYSEGDLSQDRVYQQWAKRYENNPESPLVTGHENFNKYKAFYESSKNKKADGGIMRIGYQEGSKEPVAKKTMPLLDMGGKEMDLRDNGGFVPIGRMEKADDVPARLSKNEFVFTADAVRNAGDGDVDKGAEVMYNMMKNLEDGGNVSEESQGLEGARNMFQTAQRLEEVL